MTADSLTAVCEDLLQLRDEIADSIFRPAADEICARLTLLASRVEALEATYGSSDRSETKRSA